MEDVDLTQLPCKAEFVKIGQLEDIPCEDMW